MPRFSDIEIYPPQGHHDQLWGSPGSPTDEVENAVLRSACPVAALYSEALAPLGVPGLRSALRVSVSSYASHMTQEHVSVKVLAQKLRDVPAEFAAAHFPRSAGWLSARERARLVLDGVHAAVLELARIRGMDPLQFDVCHEHVIASNFVFTAESAWKTSPDRRHQARVRLILTPDDGFGRVRLEVRPRSTSSSDPEVWCSAEMVGPGLPRPFTREAKSLRWLCPTEVAIGFKMDVRDQRLSTLTARHSEQGAWASEVANEITVREPDPQSEVGPPPPNLGRPLVMVERVFR